MRTRLPLRALGVVLLAACGGSPPTGGGSPADPQDVASVRLFNSGLGELTFHIPLFPGDTLPVEVRMYAANGSQIMSLTGGEELAFTFSPPTLASSTSVNGESLVRDITTSAPSGTPGTLADDQLGSVNWVMLMAARPAAGGILRLRTMVSAEPWTLTARGYPQLLQVAETYRGGLLTDRQHPHELISELSVGFEHPVGSRVGASLYTAPVGEPALGPVAYLHRPSAVYDPAAPLGHHTQDFTHTTFGVVTLGFFTRQVRVEASAFNGAHPDDVRTNFDPVRLDSYSARLTCNPASQWSVAAWFGHVAATGGAHVHGALDRFGASVLHSRGTWSTAFVYGADLPP